MAERVKDRRGKPRVDANIGARVTSSQGGFQATVKNISISGLLLVADRSMPEMSIVSMRLSIPGQPERNVPSFAFDITGAVVRCAASDDEPDRYELAVFLTNMPREARAALQEFIQARM